MTPRIALLVIGDGRDHLREATLQSFGHAVGENLGGLIVARVVVDDREHRRGFAGAIRAGWEQLRSVQREEPFDYVFHLEEDWRFDRALDLPAMCDLLDADPPLAQVALRRRAVNAYEARAGGVVECWPDLYEERHFTTREGRTRYYLRHALYFTTNPCMYRRSLIEQLDWPDLPRSEEAYTAELIERGRLFALWGPRAGGTWITHTGTDQRTGTGY